jgi:hypothetical protein
MSEVKVNKISPRTACGTVTLGDSGDTFTIPSGATINNQGTAVNFGATGSASWVTTVKTGDFTAVAGEGYFVNTTSGEIDVTLPAGSAGDVVAISDYANNFATANCILIQNGSDKIAGSAVNPTLSTDGVAVTLVFVDATKGWIVTDSGNQSEAPTALYVTATGGTITCSGDFRIHTFTGPGALCVSNAGNACGSNSVDYMVVAGGGGGALGAGGAGGFRESPGTASGSYTVSPLGVSPAVALPVSVTSFPITVGGGGAKSASPPDNKGSNGGLSTFSTITSAGGGGGANYVSTPSTSPNSVGGPGGSGGGGGAFNIPTNTEPGGTGNTPPVSPSQGFNGGNGSYNAATHSGGGGGGGASALGAAAPGNGAPTCSSSGGTGGNGVTTSITGSAITRSGGGGGGVNTTGSTGPFAGGTGGGGAGISPPGGAAGDGTVNTGGGAGGGSPGPCRGGAGGSGIVVIRYKFQN